MKNNTKPHKTTKPHYFQIKKSLSDRGLYSTAAASVAPRGFFQRLERIILRPKNFKILVF